MHVYMIVKHVQLDFHLSPRNGNSALSTRTEFRKYHGAFKLSGTAMLSRTSRAFVLVREHSGAVEIRSALEGVHLVHKAIIHNFHNGLL